MKTERWQKNAGSRHIYQVITNKATGEIMKVTNLNTDMEIPLDTSTIQKQMIRQNFRNFTKVKVKQTRKIKVSQ